MEIYLIFQKSGCINKKKKEHGSTLTRLPSFHNILILAPILCLIQHPVHQNVLSHILFTIMPKANDLSQLREAYAKDPDFQRHQYVGRDGIFYTNNGKIVVPNMTSIKSYITLSAMTACLLVI